MLRPWHWEDVHDANLGYIVELNPSLVDFMMLATSKLRWDEQSTMPHTQVSDTLQPLSGTFCTFWRDDH